MNTSQLNDLKNVGRNKTASATRAQSSMNAVTLGILLHHYWSAERFVGVSGPDSIYSETETKGFNYLINNDLLESNSGELNISERGRCHIEAMLNAPYPVQGWTSPIGRTS
jgi:hypothetical protein